MNTNRMAKNKNILEKHSSILKSFTNQLLRDSFITEVSAFESSRDIDIIMKKFKKINIIKIEIIKTLLENIKK